MRRIDGIVALLLVLGAPGRSASAQSNVPVDQNARAAVETARRFHELLAAGDSARVVTLLSADLQVVESGFLEDRAHYLAHHLGADMQFAKAVPSRREVVSVARQGDVVWLVSSSTASGTFRGRQVESRGAELMVLARVADAWLIRAVHWSSQPRREEKR